MLYRSNHRILNKRTSNDQKTRKELLNILSRQGNANDLRYHHVLSEGLSSKILMTAYIEEDVGVWDLCVYVCVCVCMCKTLITKKEGT